MKGLFFIGLLISSYFIVVGVYRKNHLLLLGATLSCLNFLAISQVHIYVTPQVALWRIFPVHCLYVSLPVFLLYLKKISISPIQKRDYCILIPGVLELLYVFYLWYEKDTSEILTSFSWKLYMLFAFSFNMFLALFGVCKLKNHFKNKYFMYSYYGKRQLKWGSNILISIVIYLLILTNLYLLGYTDLVVFFNNCYNFSLLIFLYYIGFATLNIDDFESRSDYKDVCKIELYKILNRIKQHLFITEVYLKSNFTQIDLCKALDLTPHKVSTVINTLTDKSFNSYINNIRIQKAIIYLNDEKYHHYTIDAIAKEVGFNSKTVFYREFRKATSFTPLRYKKLFLK